MLYVLAFPEFEPQVDRAIDRFRHLHEPVRAKLVRAHVALVFGLSAAKASDVLSRCRAIARTTPPISVDFSTHEVAYDPVEKTSKLFLICNVGKEALTALHHQLYDAPYRSELRADIPYRPHMTIATNPERGKLEQLGSSELGPRAMRGWIRALDVIDAGSGKLHTVESVPLLG